MLTEHGILINHYAEEFFAHPRFSIDRSKETIVTLDKNKFGSCGEFEMDFDGAKQRFTEPTDYVGDGFSNAEINDLPFN